MKIQISLANDALHREALEKTGFWGKRAAGCLFIANDTGRYLIAHRSAHVQEPNTWGTWGGALDEGETPKQGVTREVREESGYHGHFTLEEIFVFKHSSGFEYHNFLAHVDSEFTPTLDWETQGFKWVDFGAWPTPMHPGLKTLVSKLHPR